MSLPKKELMVNRLTRDPHSPEYAYQTLAYLQIIWESRSASEYRWQEALEDARQNHIYSKLPLDSDEKYQSLDDMLKAEFGVEVEESQRTVVYHSEQPPATPALPTAPQREIVVPDGQQKTFDILRTASELAHPQYGAWLYDTWAIHNDDYFDNELHVIPIHFGLTPHGAKLGLCSNQEPLRRITIHQSLLEPSSDKPWQLLTLGERFASDVLLHEMIHQVIFQRHGHDGNVEGQGNSSHNNTFWCAEVNRIAPMLGLPANAALTRRKRIDGKPKWVVDDGMMTRGELSSWPHSATSEAFYRGEVDSR